VEKINFPLLFALSLSACQAGLAWLAWPGLAWHPSIGEKLARAAEEKIKRLLSPLLVCIRKGTHATRKNLERLSGEGRKDGGATISGSKAAFRSSKRQLSSSLRILYTARSGCCISPGKAITILPLGGRDSRYPTRSRRSFPFSIPPGDAGRRRRGHDAHVIVAHSTCVRSMGSKLGRKRKEEAIFSFSSTNNRYFITVFRPDSPRTPPSPSPRALRRPPARAPTSGLRPER